MNTSVAKTYSADQAPHAIFPLGGIGAGSIGIGADGRFQDWEIYNRPSKGSVNGFTHFAVRAENKEGVLDTRILHGPFNGDRTGAMTGDPYNSFGWGPQRQQMTGFPSFSKSSLTGPFPAADLEFSDPGFPGPVHMRALSPFIPLDDHASSMPVAMFEVTFENTGSETIDYTLFSCMGFGFNGTQVTANKDEQGLIMNGVSVLPEDHLEHRQISLATDHPRTSYQRHLYRGNWFDALEVYWNDLSKGGPLKDRFYGSAQHQTSLAWQSEYEHSVMGCHVEVAPGESKTIRVALSWYTPNCSKYWISQNTALCEPPKDVPNKWLNYYATQWASAHDVAAEALKNWDRLNSGTLNFRNALTSSTLPAPVLDAVSANISILKSPTVLRLEDGTFYGFEGCHPDAGSCEGSCTHVWNYQQALPFLFPALERSMREADFFENQDPVSGGMAFRISLPKGIGRSTTRPCVDGQFGNVLKTYRDWKLHGSSAWLEQLWPHVKAAIEYAWHPENYDKWDPEQTGVLWGRQHHTLDMELFGPNSWLTGFYLAALSAGAEMADAMGEAETAAHYRELFSKGKKWLNDNLFNGQWFIQKIDFSNKSALDNYPSEKGPVGIVNGDIYQQYWGEEHGEIKYQVGEGCLIDQVLAEWHTRLYGLPSVYDSEKFTSAVDAIFTHNFIERLGDIANPCRVYGLENESGTIICNWPEGANRPAIPIPYTQETMHGFEYALGCQLMMIGEVEKGVKVFQAVRDRYQGHNRNPWNEIECGSNYARSMASYAAIPVLSGFTFDSVKGHMGFNPKHWQDSRFHSLWSNGQAWGEIEIDDSKASIRVIGGELKLKQLSLKGDVISASELAEQYNLNMQNGWVALPENSELILQLSQRAPK